MKRLDELDQKRQADAEWTGENYISKFTGTWIPPEERNWPAAEQRPIDKRSLRWSEFKRMTDGRLAQVRNVTEIATDGTPMLGNLIQLKALQP